MRMRSIAAAGATVVIAALVMIFVYTLAQQGAVAATPPSGPGGAAAPEGATEPASGTTTEPPVDTTSTAAAPATHSTSVAAKLTVGRAIGQMLISHVSGLTASATLLKRIRAGQVGSVILYSENISSTSQLAAFTSSLQRAAREGRNPPLFIGTDQEGGTVKRLSSAPPWLAAAQMGAATHVKSVAQAEGRATGRALLKVGVNLDFAPVADVPTSANNFLGERAFGRTTRTVEEGVTGFASGLAEAHVAGSVKHFPGLGGAGPRDTDTEIVTITLSKSQLRAAYAPYHAVAKLGTSAGQLVMISNAIYPALSGSDLPADLTPNIVRNELASTGLGSRVTVTDDLEVPAVERYPNAAVRAVRAGIDLLMFASEEAASEQAFRELEAAVKAKTITSTEVIGAANRVIALKTALHLK
jgi:beta-N-acetylhexosaminidase